MGRADYRGGGNAAPLRTADELAELLPVPLYLMISGFAGPVFPNTGRAKPAVQVGITMNKTFPEFGAEGASRILPVWIHWTQWQNVVVPLLDDGRVTSWKGIIRRLGDLLALPVNVVSPDGEVLYPEGTLVGHSTLSTFQPSPLYDYTGGANEVRSLLLAYRGLIQEQAEASGY